MSSDLKQSLRKTIETNKIDIVEFITRLYPKDNPHIIIIYAVGYDNADGVFVPVSRHEYPIFGEKFISLVRQMPKADETFYDNIKRELYAELESIESL